MFNGRKRLITALSALAMAAAVGLVPGSAQAEPDIEDVEARVDRLYHEAEMASERYNDVRLELKELNQDLASIKADERRQDERLEAVRHQVQDSIVRQYQGQNLSAVGQIVVSDDPGAFLGRLSTMSSFNDLQSQMFSDYSRELKALDIRHEATAQRANQVSDLKAQLAKEKATIDEKVDEAESLLDRLKEEQRERMMAPPAATSGRPACPPRVGPPPRSTTRWPRSAMPMSTVPPVPTPTTAPGSPWPPGPRPASPFRTPRARSTAPGRRCPQVPFSPATWSSTTARSATSACTLETA